MLMMMKVKNILTIVMNMAQKMLNINNMDTTRQEIYNRTMKSRKILNTENHYML